MNEELYNKLVCALTHNIRVCDECGKCDGRDGAEIRMNLVEKLAEGTGMPVPWASEVK